MSPLSPQPATLPKSLSQSNGVQDRILLDGLQMDSGIGKQPLIYSHVFLLRR